MAAIETVDDVMDKIKLSVAQLGISTTRKLQILFEKVDQNKLNRIANEEFMGALMKCAIFLNKVDSSNIIKGYKVNELEIDYTKFINDLSPNLTVEREETVKNLFNLIKKASNRNIHNILYQDLISFCKVQNHPNVQSGQINKNFANEMIKTAFKDIQDENDEITWDQFKNYFRGISSGYPYNTNAFIRFIQSCWSDLFEKTNNGNFSVEEAKKYVCQIEAMLAEKTRQKIKGSESENTTLLRAFKHFDLSKLGYVNYSQFVRTLESFGVMAPAKELTLFFDKWCKIDKDDKKKLFYRPFIDELFNVY